jgi:hypothetical protein
MEKAQFLHINFEQVDVLSRDRSDFDAYLIVISGFLDLNLEISYI